MSLQATDFFHPAYEMIPLKNAQVCPHIYPASNNE
jgi:hypothetical protein